MHMNQPPDDSANPGAITSQENRSREIEQARQKFLDTYSREWSLMVDQWSGDDKGNNKVNESIDALWLMYSANYLGRFGGARWAIDPVRLSNRLPEAIDPDHSRLSSLDFVLLTHLHSDHSDTKLWHLLRDTPIRWVVPEFMIDTFVESTGIRDGRLMVAEPLKTFEIHGVNITPFDGMHWEWNASTTQDGTATDVSTARGVPAIGYLLEAKGKRWLFPGDTRTYEVARLPDFGPVNVVFSHVWLGRKSALCEPPPLLEAFCSFVTGLKPQQKIVLAHLYEISRPAVDCWVQTHADQIIGRLKDQLPGVTTYAPRFWERIHP